jgi:ABC-2 type transport system permease protein
MSRARQVLELARRDFVQRAKSRAFLFSMVFIILLVAIIGPLLSYAMREPGPSTIGLVGDFPAGTDTALTTQAGLLDVKIALTHYDTKALGEAAVQNGSADVLVTSDGQLIWKKDSQPRLAAVIMSGVSNAARGAVADQLGLTSSEVSSLLAPTSFTTQILDQANNDEQSARQIGAFIGLMLLYISLLMFGQFVMMGVMEEKQTRVVEVVLSRVKPTQVLMGKVFGIGLLGLIQMVVLGAAILVTISVANVTSIDITGIGIEVFIWLIVWYLLGYTFYSFMYGALGATISRQEDMQGVAMIPVLLILPGFFIAQLAMDNPDSTLSRVASIVPVWSPMVMGVRSVISSVPIWELAAAIVLLVLAAYGLVRLGGRIYRGAILQTGGKTKLRAAWKAAAE